MRKRNKFKKRETLEEILSRLSERIFPAKLGRKQVLIDSREADGDGVLHNVLYSKELYPLQVLIEAGADVNAIGNLGYTPLHVAAWRNHPEAVALLLNAGAMLNIRCEAGKTPSDIAADAGYREVSRLLLQGV